MHPFVSGELGCANLKNRVKTEIRPGTGRLENPQARAIQPGIQ
jgi:hypothetical protein